MAQQGRSAVAGTPFVNNPSVPVVRDAKEIYAGPYAFQPGFSEGERQWTGQWIWLSDQSYLGYQRTKSTWINPGKAPEYRAFFRKTITLTSVPRHPILFITADSRFHVYINGSLAGDGPVNTGGDYGDDKSPGYWYYSALDVSKWLRPGRNTIAVEVFSWALEGSDVTSSFGRLIADLQDGEKVLASTGTSWKGSLDTAYQYKDEFLQYTASAETDGWKTEAFRDDNWMPATLQPAVTQTRLFRSNIPDLTAFPLQPATVYKGVIGQGRNGGINQGEGKEKGPGNDGSGFYGVHKKTNGSAGEYVLDFSRNRSARIAFTVLASRGDTIEIKPYEKIGSGPARSYRYICREGVNRFRSTNVCIFRYLGVRLATKKEMDVRDFLALFSTYPVQYRGAFSCSDDFYTRLWSIARYSTQLCMSDMYFDSPMHQEPIGCTGDYFIESMNSYYAFGDHWLTRQNLIQTAQMMEKNDYRMFHTSYSLLWVQMLRQYFLHTGDTLLLRELLPHADKLMQRFHGYLNKDYLVAEAPNYMFMDWITIKGFNAHHPPAMIGMGYLSALLYKAMVDIDGMRHSIGADRENGRGTADDGSVGPTGLAAPHYHALADSIRDAINRLLWDRDKHLYKDGIPFITHVAPGDWLPADSNLVTYSAHINTLAVLYGIAPQEESNRIMDYVSTQTEYELQPYFMSYVLGAVHQTGRTDLALSLMERWRKGVDTSTWTLKENWQDRTASGYSGDYSHAWGGAALRWLSQDVLGGSPESSGCDTIAIHPYVGEKISWAKGVVPLGTNGGVKVSWKKVSGGYSFEYVLPVRGAAIFYVPQEWGTGRLVVDGKVVAPGIRSFVMAGGQHRIEALK